MTKKELIDKIKENRQKIGNNMDCSRFEDTYGGYCDSREYWMMYVDGELTLDKYLNGISEEKLEKMYASRK